MMHLGSPADYVGVNGQIIRFNTGDSSHTHTIIINQDQLCEIVLANGAQPIQIVQPSVIVTIDDSQEPECSKLCSKTNNIYEYYI